MRGAQRGQEIPDPSIGSFGTFRLSVPEPEPRLRAHELAWINLTKRVPKTEADWQAVRRRHDFDSAERIPDTLTQLLDPLRKSNLHKIIFFAGCYVDSYQAGNRTSTYGALRAYLDNATISEVSMNAYLTAIPNKQDIDSD
ncbi:hypothetical protein FDECE_18052 [Fusarium decemcellulare]|nr:hypothetical protein FDECE_18052 [Fusarium decemcellulare]